MALEFSFCLKRREFLLSYGLASFEGPSGKRSRGGLHIKRSLDQTKMKHNISSPSFIGNV